jgi:hypothetical protein
MARRASCASPFVLSALRRSRAAGNFVDAAH